MRHWALLILLVPPPGTVTAELLRERDPDSGARAWILRQNGLELTLRQLLPDQTRAFYLGRGFSAQETERIARSCVFQAVARNIGKQGTLNLDLARWQLHSDTGARPIKSKSEWDREFSNLEVPRPARIAFRWATFPDDQKFRPADYNWGMITFGLSPGSRFHLDLHWRLDDTEHRAHIADMQCSKDTDQ